MRVISPSKRYEISLFSPVIRLVTDSHGTTSETVSNVAGDDAVFNAKFEQSGLRPNEAAIVLTKFKFSGIPEGVNPLSTVGVFDTDAAAFQLGWPASRKLAIEAQFRAKAELYPSNLLVIEEETAPIPWPAYDEASDVEVLAFQKALRYDAETILRYEVENLNREEIVTAMNAIISGVPADVGEISVTA